jgi:hypothetical protein
MYGKFYAELAQHFAVHCPEDLRIGWNRVSAEGRLRLCAKVHAQAYRGGPLPGRNEGQRTFIAIRLHRADFLNSLGDSEVIK